MICTAPSSCRGSSPPSPLPCPCLAAPPASSPFFSRANPPPPPTLRSLRLQVSPTTLDPNFKGLQSTPERAQYARVASAVFVYTKTGQKSHVTIGATCPRNCPLAAAMAAGVRWLLHLPYPLLICFPSSSHRARAEIVVRQLHVTPPPPSFARLLTACAALGIDPLTHPQINGWL